MTTHAQLIDRESWIEQAFNYLEIRTGKCSDDNERKHMNEWARALADSYYDESQGADYSPKDAVNEDLSYL